MFLICTFHIMSFTTALQWLMKPLQTSASSVFHQFGIKSIMFLEILDFKFILPLYSILNMLFTITKAGQVYGGLDLLP